MSQPSSSGAVVVDSNILVSICSKETTHPTAQQVLNDYTAKGWTFYAPGVVVAEALFVLCRKLSDGTLTTPDYDKATVAFIPPIVFTSPLLKSWQPPARQSF